MLDLEIIPERSLGCDTWEFVLGMHFSQSVAIIQSQVGTIRGVQVLYSDQRMGSSVFCSYFVTAISNPPAKRGDYGKFPPSGEACVQQWTALEWMAGDVIQKQSHHVVKLSDHLSPDVHLKNPLSVDLVINMPQDGVRLIFDPVAQRLKIIEIYNMKLVKLRYSGMCFNSEEITPSIEQIEHCFGATHPGLYDSQRHLFALNFRGLSFYFPVDSKFEDVDVVFQPGYAHGLGSLQFPNGGSPVVSRTTIYYGSQHQASNTATTGSSVSVAPLPDLPLSCVRHQLHLRRATVLRDAHATQGLRLHMFTQGTSRSLEPVQVNVCRVVRFGDSCQSVARALGAPQRLYYKADDKMRIHRASSRRRPPPASDYFFNYFTLGLDVLFDARTHQVKKFVLHTNYPGHYNFNTYHRCEFELQVQPDKCDPNSLVDRGGAVSITAYSKWECVQRALRVCERPVVLNRASSTNTTNPFGSTFCYGYQDLIFEVMSNNYIASITLYQPEGARPHPTLSSVA